MQRRVERKYFDQWAAANRPDAIRKLANKSDVAMAYIERVRAGYVPPKELYRKALSDALGVPETELFPFIEPALGSSGDADS